MKKYVYILLLLASVKVQVQVGWPPLRANKKRTGRYGMARPVKI